MEPETEPLPDTRDHERLPVALDGLRVIDKLVEELVPIEVLLAFAVIEVAQTSGLVTVTFLDWLMVPL